MLEIQFGTFPILQTERLQLRQARPEDAAGLLAMRSDPNAMRYIDRPLMKDIAEAESLIERFIDGFNQNQAIAWIITLRDQPELMGNITFWKIDRENHRAEIGYMLLPAHHGKGFMQEALRAVLQYGFETMRLHSVEANVNPENEASSKLLERCGFVREAYFRENYYFDGKFLDSAIYCILSPVGS